MDVSFPLFQLTPSKCEAGSFLLFVHMLLCGKLQKPKSLSTEGSKTLHRIVVLETGRAARGRAGPRATIKKLACTYLMLKSAAKAHGKLPQQHEMTLT